MENKFCLCKKISLKVVFSPDVFVFDKDHCNSSSSNIYRIFNFPACTNFLLKYSHFKYMSVSCAGYLLADDPQGETPLIPSEVMEFSIKHSTEVDINTTLQILGSPGEKASSIPGCNRTDSVIRCVVQPLRALLAGREQPADLSPRFKRLFW